MRYGTVRARVAGLQAVLADGSIIERPTAAQGQRRLRPVGPARRQRGNARRSSPPSAGAWCPGSPAAWPRSSACGRSTRRPQLLADVRPRLPSLDAAEFLSDEGLQLVLDHLGLPAPVPTRSPVYVLLECAALADPTDELAEALAQAGIEDAVVADDSAERERLWRFREAHTEALSAAGVPHKMDVGVPLARLAEFAAARARGGRAPGPRRARDPLRPPRGRQRPRQRARPRPRRRRGRRGGAARGGRVRRHDQRRARRRRGRRRAGSSSCARPASCARWLRSSARSTPTGLLNPGVMLP